MSAFFFLNFSLPQPPSPEQECSRWRQRGGWRGGCRGFVLWNSVSPGCGPKWASGGLGAPSAGANTEQKSGKYNPNPNETVTCKTAMKTECNNLQICSTQMNVGFSTYSHNWLQVWDFEFLWKFTRFYLIPPFRTFRSELLVSQPPFPITPFLQTFLGSRGDPSSLVRHPPPVFTVYHSPPTPTPNLPDALIQNSLEILCFELSVQLLLVKTCKSVVVFIRKKKWWNRKNLLFIITHWHFNLWIINII